MNSLPKILVNARANKDTLMNKATAISSNSKSLDFAQISNHELITRFEKLVRTERKITHLILVHINEIENRKIYAELGFDGIYTYLTRGLGYSEASAHRRLQSARLLKNIPQIASKIEDGSLNLSQLAQVQKCIKESEKKGTTVSINQTEQLLEKLENRNSFDTHKTLAIEMNFPVQVFDKITPQQDESVRIQITLTKEEYEELQRAKSLLSHVCPEGNLSDVVATLARKFNTSKLIGRNSSTRNSNARNTEYLRHDQVKTDTSTKKSTLEKAKATKHERRSTHSVSAKEVTKECGPSFTTLKTSKAHISNFTSNRKYISIHTKRRLLIRANYCCEYSDSQSKQKCGSKYKLEIDHRHPIALGGNNDFENLRVLCQTHNLMAGRQMGLIN